MLTVSHSQVIRHLKILKMKLLAVALVLCLVAVPSYCDDPSCNDLAFSVRFDLKTMSIQQYCKLNDRMWEKGDEPTVDLTECDKCTCGLSNFKCCGIGHNDPTLQTPVGCFKKNLENCCYQFVQQANDAVPCGEKVCPET